MLCDTIHEALARGDSIGLDCAGVTTLASLFLNAAVGCLYSSFDKDDLDARLHWKGLDPTDASVPRFVQRNAIKFFAAHTPQQAALANAAARAVSD